MSRHRKLKLSSLITAYTAVISLVDIQDTLYDREPDAAAAHSVSSCLIRRIEDIPDLIQILFIYLSTIISDAELNFTAVPVKLDHDDVVAVFDCIRHEVA